jgi:phosphoenolpyruvate-protein phosphotransferase (PTS system enzyme I)
MTRVLTGVGASPATGAGTAQWYALDIPEYPRDADDPDAELERFSSARDRAREAIADERDRAADRVGESEAAIFDAHRQFLDDPQIETSVETALRAGRSAEAAVEAAFAEPIEQFESMEGRTAERADDLRDVRDRLLRELTGATSADLAALPEGTVLLAERLAPSDTARLDADRVAGIATVTGGRTAHAAIVARSLGLPAVVGIGEALRDCSDGQTVIVDGSEGEVVADPDEERLAAAAEDREVSVIGDPVATADGRRIEVAANVGTTAELDAAVESGADGIGLFRSEFLFLERDEPPDESEQVDAYETALEAFPSNRVIVRTLDVGGDKPVPYLETPEGSNPFLGERGIRRSLGPDRDLFETQLRALLRAGATAASGGDLAVMFPMVADVAELDAALERVDAVAERLEREDVEYARPELGVMIETPAATFVADALAARVDFLSLGTNDLAQYVMAADRENERVRELHDPLHPSVLCAIERTVDAGHDGDAWVGMCGEMAGDPDLTELLVGLGLDELSMSAVSVPRVKAAVRELSDERARELADRALASETRAEVRDVLGIRD